MRKKVVLACAICQARNYTTTKNTLSGARLEIQKFCKRCNAYTTHRETL
ncbi:50S ribosomal protein L33 [Aureibacillus halotolerans]|nr:50S ribosomal protein L33 [Aureibacillus halotolerans]